MGQSKLLFNKRPLVVDVDLAMILGVNESMIIQQIHYWLILNKESNRNFKDGYYWVYNSYPEWQKQFPFWSTSSIKRMFIDLEDKGYLISANYNKAKFDRTKWYRINYDMLQTSENSPLYQNDTTMVSELDHATYKSDPTNTIDYSETTTETNFYVLEKRLYTLSGNDDFLSFYLQTHKEYLKKEHVRVTEEQIEYINNCIRTIKDEFDISFDDWKEQVTQHFKELPDSNNGNILAFFKTSLRRFDINPEEFE